MTETEWDRCADPGLMLVACWRAATARKRRLFACAACRLVCDRLTQRACRRALEVAELFADGKRTPAQLMKADEAANALFHDPGLQGADLAALWCCAVDEDQIDDMRSFVVDSIRGIAPEESVPQAQLLRCLLGPLPFRPITLAPAHRTPTVVSLAQAAYDERHLPFGELDLQRLAVLSDALEEAGATGEILDHLRSPGPHVRGCWGLDLALGLS